MAGEIEEPFALDFRVDSLHSGSTSSGSFESEALCWERRSSFSHNRYLEEVEKCSKPGSVTEKKAYFEARFKNKGFLVPSSPICQNMTYYETSQNGTSDMMSNDEEIVVACETQVKDGTSCSEPQLECTDDGTCNVDCIPEHVMVDGADDVEPGRSLKEDLDGETSYMETSHHSDMTTGMSYDNYANQKNSNGSLNVQQTSESQGNVPSKSELINPRQRRAYSYRITSKESENKADQKARNAPVRSRTEKQTSNHPVKCLLQKSTKYERGSKTGGADEINRNRTIVEPQSCTSQKVSSRVYQSTNRFKATVTVTKPGMRQDRAVTISYS